MIRLLGFVLVSIIFTCPSIYASGDMMGTMESGASEPEPEFADSEPSYGGGDDTWKTKILEFINQLRAKHQAKPLVMDAAISTRAQNYSDHFAVTGKIEITCKTGGCGYGENQAMGPPSGDGMVAGVTALVQRWYAQEANYDYATGEPKPGKIAGAFTALVWKASTKVGIGGSIKKSNGYIFLVVQFAPPGNVRGRYKQNVGGGGVTAVAVKEPAPVFAEDAGAEVSFLVPTTTEWIEIKEEVIMLVNEIRIDHKAAALTFDETIMDRAQQQAVAMASAGKLMSSCTTGCKYGEIMTEVEMSVDITITIKITLQTWFQESTRYEYSVEESTKTTEGFTAFIWSGIQQFGMGVATVKSTNKAYIVFQFDQPVNVPGKFAQNVQPAIPWREDILSYINVLRKQHKAPPLVLDTNLTTRAQNSSDHCAVIGKLEFTCKGYCGFGENQAMGGQAKDKNLTAGLIKLIQLWYAQNTNYDFTLNQAKPGKSVGSFTALVWKSSTKVGFGASIRATNGYLYLIALFSPPGNVKGSYKQNVFPGPGVTAAPEESPTARAGDDDYIIPTLPELMEIQNEVTFSINEIRLQHDSSPLVIDSMLSKTSQSQAEILAKTGKLTPSCTKGCTYGELMKEVPGGTDIVLAINMTMQTWFETSYTYEYKFEKSTTSYEAFTAFSWSSTQKFGVGVATSKTTNKIYIVFQFDQPVNVPGKFAENVRPPIVWREEILSIINILRAKHQAPPLVLDPALSAKAQDFTDNFAITGKLEITCKGSCGYGENQAMGPPSKDKNMTTGLNSLIQLWYSQNTNYDFILNQAKPGKSTGTFTALVWKSSTKIGLGASVRQANGYLYLLVLFSPPGNMKGGYRLNVLPASDAVATTEASPVPVEETGGDNGVEESVIEPTVTELTEIKDELLTSVNDVRVEHDSPPVTIDDTLTKTSQTQAQTLAKTGKLTPSCTKDCKYTEIMKEVVGGTEFLVVLKITLQEWYEEGVQYDYSLEKPSTSTDEFTALIWMSSTKIGVGIAKRKDGKIYIVIQFDPPANVPGKFADNVHPPTVWRQQILSIINVLRVKHQAPPLVLDTALSTKAQQFTDKFAIIGKLEITCKGSCNYGENQAMGPPAKDKNMTTGINNLIQMWYTQNTNYDFTLNQAKPGKSTGAFTALVWKSSTKIGIGASIRPANGYIYLLVLFAPPGNMKGGYRLNVLPAVEPSATTEASPVPADETGGDNGVDESVVVPTVTELKEINDELLTSVNDVRADHDSPPVTIDDTLTKTSQTQAQKLAKTGKLIPSCIKDCKYTEIMKEVVGGTEFLVVIKITLEEWFKEGVQYDYSLETSSTSTDEFTAIVWMSSTKIGVGVAKRKVDGTIYIVIQFDPLGNIPGQFALNVKPSIVFRTEILAYINTLRAKHKAPALVLDTAMTTKAQDFSDDFALASKLSVTCKSACVYGENQAMGALPKDNNITTGLITLVEIWYTQSTNYDYVLGQPKSATSTTTSFTALVWKSTTKVGIGASVNYSKKTIYFEILFSPAGNVKGAFTKNVLPAEDEAAAVADNTPDFTAQVLIIINEMRAEHDSPALVMDDQWKTLAETQVETLAKAGKLTSSCTKDCKYSELMAEIPTGMEIMVAINITLQRWYAEGVGYDYTVAVPKTTTSHFTTLIWKASIRFGFGIATLKDGRIFIVLLFDPAGNVPGEYLQNVFPSSAWKKKVLIEINILRAKHSAPPLVMDEAMTLRAQNFSDSLALSGKIDISCKSSYCSYGENQAMGPPAKNKDMATGVMVMVQRWYSQSAFYDYKLGQAMAGKYTGAFTALVWKRSTKIGMGGSIRAANGYIFFVVQFAPPGNTQGLYKANVYPVRDENSPVTIAPTPGPVDNSPFLCATKTLCSKPISGATPFQTAGLKAINDLRKKHQSPDVCLDANLNKNAQRWAEQIARQGKLDLSCIGNDCCYGEIQASRLPNDDIAAEVIGSINSWYGEKVNYDFKTGLAKPGKQATGFTAIVWKGSTKIGIGAFAAEEHIYVVIEFSPPGNTLYMYTSNVLPEKA